jgi:hypothetical protein
MLSEQKKHKLIGALGRALHAMYPDREILSHQYDPMRKQIQNLRIMRTAPTSTGGYKTREQDRITVNFSDVFSRGRRDITVKVGKPGVERTEKANHGNTIKTYRYRATVGWLWYRNVYLKFYKDNCLDKRWLVLKAEELSVNHRAIRLYEGLAFEFATGQTHKVYIGQAGIGALSADVKLTQKEAIDRALKLADRIVDKRLLGEEKNDYETT